MKMEYQMKVFDISSNQGWPGYIPILLTGGEFSLKTWVFYGNVGFLAKIIIGI